jgi:enoyl-CoA hydratase/carnithine racemase
VGTIALEVTAGIAIITLDNLDFHNAVDAPMRAELANAYTAVEQDPAIRVAIIHGAGKKAFCSGGYIDGYLEGNAFGPGGSGPPPVPKPWPTTKPFIAAINGYALAGGFALALACDLRVVGRSARIGPTGLKRGAVQGAQTIQRLTRLIGAAKALEILLLSKYLSGEEAAACGLAMVADDDKVLETAKDVANIIAGFSPWTVAQTKKLVYEAQHLPLDQAIALEDSVAAEGYRRPAALEGFRAFGEKRKPTFE